MLPGVEQPSDFEKAYAARQAVLEGQPKKDKDTKKEEKERIEPLPATVTSAIFHSFSAPNLSNSASNVKRNYSTSTSLLASYANKVSTIRQYFTDQFNYLKDCLPKLHNLEHRVDILLKVLHQLKLKKQDRTPDILAERDNLVALLSRPAGSRCVLENYVKIDLVEWTKPLSSKGTSSGSTMFRVSLLVNLKANLETLANQLYTNWKEWSPLYDLVDAKYSQIEKKLKEVDDEIRTSQEMAPPFRDFAGQVAREVEERFSQSQDIRISISYYIDLAREAWTETEINLIQLRNEMKKLCEWLHDPDMPGQLNEAAKKNVIRLFKLKKLYEDKQLTSNPLDTTANWGKLNAVQKQLQEELPKLLDGRKIPLDPIPVSWAKNTGQTAVKHLATLQIELEQAQKDYLELKKSAVTLYESISAVTKKFEGQDKLDTVPPCSLRAELLPVSSGWSFGFGWFSSSTPSATSSKPELVVKPKNVDVEWSKKVSNPVSRLVNPLTLPIEARETILPPGARDLENVSMDKWTDEDCWTWGLRNLGNEAIVFLCRMCEGNIQVAKIAVLQAVFTNIISKLEAKSPEANLLRQKLFWKDFYWCLRLQIDRLNQRADSKEAYNSLIVGLEKSLASAQRALIPLVDATQIKACQQSIAFFQQMIALLKGQQLYVQHAYHGFPKLVGKEKFFGSGEADMEVPNKIRKPLKPPKLSESLQGLLDVENPLPAIESNLIRVEQAIEIHEAEKLQFHQANFLYQSRQMEFFLEEVQTLAGQILLFEQFAKDIASLYASTAIIAKSDVLSRQLKALLESHNLLSIEIQSFKTVLANARQVLQDLVSTVRKKQSKEKQEWWQEQIRIGFKNPVNVAKRLKQLEEQETKLLYVLQYLDELWKVAQDGYASANKQVESLNLKQNGVWSGYWSGYVAPPILSNPFTTVDAAAELMLVARDAEQLGKSS